MEQKRWFLLLDGQVSGPYGDPDIEAKVNGVPPTKDDAPLIWGRGQAEWMSPDKWRAAVQAMNAQEALETQKSREWKMKVHGKELSPMNIEELLEQLKEYSDMSPIRLWTEGFEDWKEVFQIPKIMTELGVSRRKHPRVPIMGSLKCEASAGIIHVKVISISEGGVGVTESKGLQLGEKVRGTMTSPNLFAPFTSNMEVVYLGNDGYAGMRFLGLPPEAKSAVIEYVKKFQQVQR